MQTNTSIVGIRLGYMTILSEPLTRRILNASQSQPLSEYCRELGFRGRVFAAVMRHDNSNIESHRHREVIKVRSHCALGLYKER